MLRARITLHGVAGINLPDKNIGAAFAETFAASAAAAHETAFGAGDAAAWPAAVAAGRRPGAFVEAFLRETK